MRLQARLKRFNQHNLLFEVPYGLEKLEIGKDYTLDIKPYKQSRSLDQNNLLWALLEQFAQETGYDTWELYMWLIIESNIKVYTIEGISEKDAIRDYRAYEKINDGCYRVWNGSSRFDSAEMTKFIDFIIQKASEMNIYLYMEGNNYG